MNFGIARVRSLFGSATKHALVHFPHLTYLTCLTTLGCALPFVVHAQESEQEFRFQSAGARVGFGAESTSNHFLQSEAFLNYNLWHWCPSTNWHLQSRLGLSAGWLGQRGDNAFIGTLGPVLEISRTKIPFSIEGGFCPSYISRYRFSSTDLGTRAQFTSHFGLNWDVTPHWRLGYRFQHMSNAGLKEPNPGFNLHVLSVGYLF